MKRFFVSAFVLTLCSLVFLTTTATDSFADSTLRVKGSPDMAARVEKAAKEFMQTHKGVNIIVSGGVSGSPLKELLDRNCEIVMASRRTTNEDKRAAKEKGFELAGRLVGNGSLAFVTYPENKVSEITVAQLKQLLRGESYLWNQVGGNDDRVVVVSLETTENDTRSFILHDLLEGTGIRAKVERAASFGGILQKVKTTKGAIGYCRIRDLEDKSLDSAGVKVLKIKENADSPGVAPTRETIANGTYPIKRPFSLLYDHKAPEMVKKFVEFTASKGWGEQQK